MSKLALRGGVDFFSGLLLVGIAAVAIWFISSLEVGTALEMGPGYFPLAIALVLGGMGLFLVVRGLTVSGPQVERLEPRPLLLILGSFLVFALLLDHVGLIVAILAQVTVAAFASRETRLWQSLTFGAVLALLSSVLFVGLLGIPVSLLP